MNKYRVMVHLDGFYVYAGTQRVAGPYFSRDFAQGYADAMNEIPCDEGACCNYGPCVEAYVNGHASAQKGE